MKKKSNKGNEKFFKLIRNFKKLGPKEFFKRWGQGIQGITPIQIARGNLIGIIPVIIGTIIGIVYTILSKTLWLLLILIGGFIISIFQGLGYLQKYIRLKVQEKINKMSPEELMKLMTPQPMEKKK